MLMEKLVPPLVNRQRIFIEKPSWVLPGTSRGDRGKVFQAGGIPHRLVIVASISSSVTEIDSLVVSLRLFISNSIWASLCWKKDCLPKLRANWSSRTSTASVVVPRALEDEALAWPMRESDEGKPFLPRPAARRHASGGVRTAMACCSSG